MRNAPVDMFKLPVMLTALRLPSFQKHWQDIAEQADKEDWPAARFLAVLAEYEIVERETRRIQRHLNETKFLGGKTLATYQFEAMLNLPKAHIEALAEGDWIERDGNLITIGNSGTGKTHILCTIGHALIEAGYRVLYFPQTGLKPPASSRSALA